MKFTNVRELKANTSSVLRTVKNGDTVLITTHGRPTALVVPVSEDDIEDVLLEHSPVLRQKIAAGFRDIRAGRTVALSEYVKHRVKRSAKTA